MGLINEEYQVTESKFKPRRLVDDLSLSIPLILLIGSLIVSAISTTELLGWRLSRFGGSYIKFLPLLMDIAATMIIALSLTPGRLVYCTFSSIRVNKFLTAFFILAFPGALFARFVLNMPYTYFSQAVMLIAFFCSFFIFRAVPENYWHHVRSWIVKTYGILTVVASIAVLVNLASEFGKTDSDTVLFLVQGVALTYYCWKFGLSRIVLLVTTLLLTLFTFKNTAILILLIYFFFFYLLPKRLLRKFSFVNITGLFIVALVALIGLASSYLWLQTQFAGYSDGNTPFRIFLYEYRMNQFFNSPIIGQLFTGATAYQFENMFNGITVPTHSDWIDILAQGGLVGFLLFTGIFIHIFRLLLSYRRNMIHSDRKGSEMASWLILFIIGVLFSSIINPTLNSPDVAYIFWVALAFAHRLIYVANVPTKMNNLKTI